MKNIFDAEKRYANSLTIAKNHLEKKKQTGSRSKISDVRTDYIVSINAECPICGVPLIGGNHNTEHIHPISLGGINNLENKIQICKLCNGARNQVMQAMMGQPPYHKNYPNNWIEVKRFLLWCELSIDEKHLTEKLTPSVNELFMKFRTGGMEFPFQPKSAFGRASTWKIGDEPNYEFNNNIQNVANKIMNTKKKNRSIILRFFDTIFDYKPNKNIEVVSTVETINSINDIEQSQLKKEKKGKAQKQTYPIINNLNSARTGLRLPNDPQDFASVILWYVENCNNYSTWGQRRDALKELNIVSRPSNALVAVNSVLCEDGEYDVDTIESRLLSDLTSLIDAMKERYSQYDLVFGSNETESSANLEQYFEAVKNYLLTPNGNMNIDEERRGWYPAKR